MAVPQVAIDAVTHYLQKGVPRGPAIGIVAVLYAGESQLNPGSQGTQASETPGALNPAGAWGIASWNGARQATLKAFALAKGLAVGLVTTQLDFVLTEMFNSYPATKAAYLAELSYALFIPVFVQDYERPAAPQAEIARSIAFAGTLDAAVPALVAAVPVETPVVGPPVETPIIPGVTLGGLAIDPAALAALRPVIDAITASFVRAIIAQLTGIVVVAPASAAPAPAVASTLDLGALVGVLAPILTAALGSTLPGLIATEIAKVAIPQALAAKP